jgi:hypothetical protein
MFARSTACLSDGFSSGRDGQGKLMLARVQSQRAPTSLVDFILNYILDGAFCQDPEDIFLYFFIR